MMRGITMRKLSPGLADVLVVKSPVSFVEGQRGLLEYRGILIEELAKQSSFPETPRLLLFDRLPEQSELEQFTADITQHRRIKYRMTDLLKCLPEHRHPMDALQAAVITLRKFYPAQDVLDRHVQYWSTIRLIAKVPTIVATYYRLRREDEQVQPRDDLDQASNFLSMLIEKVPDPLVTKVLDACLILHAEHTMDASTFIGLGTASTLTDPYMVVPLAIGTLKGPSMAEPTRKPWKCWRRSEPCKMFDLTSRRGSPRSRNLWNSAIRCTRSMTQEPSFFKS